MAAKSHRALKITGIVIGVIVGIALIAMVALNIYMRVAFSPFFDRAESSFDIPGINTGFVPQDLDHVEADDSWLFSGYMADHSPSPIYRRATDGTFTTGSGDEVELFCLDSRNLTEDLVGPPMQEGIESHDGRVYTTDESASNKYIFGKLCGAGRVYAVQL